VSPLDRRAAAEWLGNHHDRRFIAEAAAGAPESRYFAGRLKRQSGEPLKSQRSSPGNNCALPRGLIVGAQQNLLHSCADYITIKLIIFWLLRKVKLRQPSNKVFSMRKSATTIRTFRLQKGLSRATSKRRRACCAAISRASRTDTRCLRWTRCRRLPCRSSAITQFFADDSPGRQSNLQKLSDEELRFLTQIRRLLLEPERQRPQAAAGHGEEIRRHGNAISCLPESPTIRHLPRWKMGSTPWPPASRACSFARFQWLEVLRPHPLPGGSSARLPRDGLL